MDQKPSVGRIVHYYPAKTHGIESGRCARERKGQPYPAIVTHVWGDSVVNLRVFDDGSVSFGQASATPAVTSCSLGNPETPPDSMFWCWPPRV